MSSEHPDRPGDDKRPKQAPRGHRRRFLALGLVALLVVLWVVLTPHCDERQAPAEPEAPAELAEPEAPAELAEPEAPAELAEPEAPAELAEPRGE